MQIARSQVVDRLKSEGENTKANLAEAELPQKVDPEKDSELLSTLGIDPLKFTDILPGNFGG